MASSTSSSILHVPPPWHLKCDTWIVPFKTSASSPLPRDKILAPLEAASDAWTSEQKTGKFTGGVGYAYIVRYTESPVGTYDELAIVPGNYNAPEGVGCKGNYMRITGIWVSHEATLLNGRKNWNIPKHIANFKFTPTTSKPLPLRVEVTEPGSKTPFFATTIHPMSYSPTFSFNSAWSGYFGLPTKSLQPPLPTGNPPHVEVGTDAWMRISPSLRSSKCHVVWLDMQQPGSSEKSGDGEHASSEKGNHDNWWPGIGRWRLALAMENADLDLGDPDLFRDGKQVS